MGLTVRVHYFVLEIEVIIYFPSSGTRNVVGKNNYLVPWYLSTGNYLFSGLEMLSDQNNKIN